jgi:hypothetical protein
MGYGQLARPITVQQKKSPRSTGFVMAFATVAVLFLGLSLTRLIS